VATVTRSAKLWMTFVIVVAVATVVAIVLVYLEWASFTQTMACFDGCPSD
jgi:hypothetical protein